MTIRSPQDDHTAARGEKHEGACCERVLEGVGVAPGFAIGPVHLYAKVSFDVEQRRISPEEEAAEVKRFEEAVARSERDLHKIASVAQEKLGSESASIFEAQALMLRDDALYGPVVQYVREHHCNAAYAVQVIMAKHRQLLKASENEYLRERADDMLDVQDRIIRHLRRGKILSAIERDAIVVAENLTAADIILFSRRNILGCAMDFGGSTSHVSIMARALGVPAVVGMHGITEVVEDGDTVILDGLRGRVIVHPTPETIEAYRTQQRRYKRFLLEQKQLTPLPAETLDGHRVRLRANLELRQELSLLEEHGAEGIGLFRTEFLFLMQGQLSYTEDEQVELYQRIVEEAGAHGVTFRVLDLGGDKMLPMAHREQNPFLGWRGIRVLLDKPDLLIPQVRAILRASAYGPARILLPMVTNLQEVFRFRKVFERCQQELRDEGTAFDESVPIGIMVEVPAVALMARQFAREVDFFSISSNDLTQYVLAVDRGNDLVGDLYQELHPAVLTLIKQTVEAAHAEGISVGICGEVASNPRATALLVGLGLDELSASPTYLPEVKRVLRTMELSEGLALARQALQAQDADEVITLVDQWLQEHACGLNYFIETGSKDLVASSVTNQGT